MTFFTGTHSRRLPAILMALIALCPVTKADIFVPADFPTIQSAINAAQPGDIIHLAAGQYAETLTITNSLTLLGSGTSNCVVYALTNVPVVSVTGPAQVTLSNFEIEGGQYMGPGWSNGFSPIGIQSTNASLVLNTIVLNQFINDFVSVNGGSLAATNVALWTRNVLGGCDIGLELDGCSATINGLTQDAGHLDHTINVNGLLSTNHACVTVSGCRIRTSSLDYGNCVRTYVNSTVSVTNCFLYRATGETVPPFPSFIHSGVSVNGYSNTVVISGNIISNVPWAIYCYGSLGGNQVLIESNLLLNSPIGGVVWDAMFYRGVDLGGGSFGSHGGNIFLEPPSPGTNYCADVLFTNADGICNANIFALHNTWSNPNADSVVYDKLDNPALGRLITQDLTVTATGRDPAGRPIISWNERGAGEHYTVETCTTLATSNWVSAPGSWPITNPGLSPLIWTNPQPAASNLFFRVRSQVP